MKNNTDYPIISIVTPSYNQGQFITDTIESVINQEGDFYIDYIIMDGASSDMSVDVIRKFADIVTSKPVAKEIDGVVFHQYGGCKGVAYRWVSKKDRGQSAAINEGFELSIGGILSWINSDDTYFGDSVFKLVASSNFRDFLFGRGMWISVDGKDLIEYPTYFPSKSAMFYQCVLCQPAVFFTKNVYKKLGKIDEALKNSFDYEFWMRGISNNVEWKKINFILATSRMHFDNKTMVSQSISQTELDLLKRKYFKEYLDNQSVITKIKKAIYKRIIHKGTVERVNKLHALLGSGVFYEYK